MQLIFLIYEKSVQKLCFCTFISNKRVHTFFMKNFILIAIFGTLSEFFFNQISKYYHGPVAQSRKRERLKLHKTLLRYN